MSCGCFYFICFTESSQSYGNTHTLSWRRTKPTSFIISLSLSRTTRRRSGTSNITTRHRPFHLFFFVLLSFAFSCSNSSILLPSLVILAYFLPFFFSNAIYPCATNLPSAVLYRYLSCALLTLGNLARMAGALGAIAATRTTPVNATVASKACCIFVFRRFFFASVSTIPISEIYHDRGQVVIVATRCV